MNSKYIFASDIDGTLLQDDKTVNETTLKAFKLAQENGHITAVATGRCIKRTITLLDKIPYIDYFICNNGSVIFDVKKNEVLFIKSVNPHCYPKIANFAKEHNTGFKLHTDFGWFGTPELEDQDILVEIDEDMDKKIRKYMLENPFDPKLYNGHLPTQISINASESFCKEYYPKFVQWFKKDSTVYLTNSVFIDVNAKDVSKWSGLEMLANILSINTNMIVTFGDSGNDLEMLLKAKENGYPLLNSKKELSDILKPRIGSNNSDAIGQVILSYLKKTIN